MKTKLICLIAGLMTMTAAQTIQADDTKPAPPNREALREQFQNLSPEEREAKRKEFMEKRGGGEERKKLMKELGLKPEELEKLSEKERAAKIKEAADKKLSELQKKKTDGTLSGDEKQTLQRLEQMKKFMESRRGEGRPEGRPAGPRKSSEKSDK